MRRTQQPLKWLKTRVEGDQDVLQLRSWNKWPCLQRCSCGVEDLRKEDRNRRELSLLCWKG